MYLTSVTCSRIMGPACPRVVLDAAGLAGTHQLLQLKGVSMQSPRALKVLALSATIVATYALSGLAQTGSPGAQPSDRPAGGRADRPLPAPAGAYELLTPQ